MAAAVRARHAPANRAFSYRELSSDEDDLDDSDFSGSDSGDLPLAQPRRSSKRQQAAKASSPPRKSLRNLNNPRPTRGRLIDHGEASSSAVVAHVGASRPLKRKRTAVKSPSQTPRKSQKVGASRVKPAKPAKPAVVIPSDGIVPAWQMLPYEVWQTVFDHAVEPLHDGNFQPTRNATWAVKAARTCRAFTEPALTALYKRPPLFYLDQPHGLLRVLKAENTMFDYRQKVKCLELDAVQTLAYSATHLGKLNLVDLVTPLQRLSELDISDSRNRPPYRAPVSGSWSYPSDLFSAMSAAGIRLKRLRLNGTMLPKNFASEHGMMEIMREPCLQSLVHLTLSHLFLDVLDGPENVKYFDVDAFKYMPDLRSVCVESCEFDYNWDLLSSLPSTLTELSIIYCTSLDGEALKPFFEGHCRHLRSLTLNYNNRLDLFMLPHLKEWCPVLEHLTVDLTYYSSAMLFQNSDATPLYDALLKPDDVPQWPSTLVSIEMVNLRQWSPEAAIGFLESLTDSAGELRRLRSLVIRAMIDVNWRDRATFRDKWISRLERAFLRPWVPPSRHLASQKAFRQWKTDELAIATPAPKRSTRQLISLKPDIPSDDEGLTRGMCEVVEVNIDNMRPSEVHFTEGDFLDSGPEGSDDDYTGTDRASSPQRYAW